MFRCVSFRGAYIFRYMTGKKNFLSGMNARPATISQHRGTPAHGKGIVRPPIQDSIRSPIENTLQGSHPLCQTEAQATGWRPGIRTARKGWRGAARHHRNGRSTPRTSLSFGDTIVSLFFLIGWNSIFLINLKQEYYRSMIYTGNRIWEYTFVVVEWKRMEKEYEMMKKKKQRIIQCPIWNYSNLNFCIVPWMIHSWR